MVDVNGVPGIHISQIYLKDVSFYSPDIVFKVIINVKSSGEKKVVPQKVLKIEVSKLVFSVSSVAVWVAVSRFFN